MATAFAPPRPTEATLGGVGDVSTHQLCIPTLHNDDVNSSDVSSSQLSHGINVPPPNPPFVFPSQASSSAPSSFSRSTGRRPQSAIELQSRTLNLGADAIPRSSRSPALPDFSFNPGTNLSPRTASRPTRSPALPDFSFNPGATLAPDESLLSPPLSPQSPRMIPIRNGHRRGTSEFVGGKLKAGESISVMSTSPTGSEGGFASPKLSPTEGHPRRGHAHRRSAAISSHDLTMILKPNNSPTLRGSSAPSSPADFDDKYRNFPEPSIEPPKTEPVPQQAKEEVQEISSQPASQPSSPPKPTARTRVGFSDTLEFIPRPLSLVSNDTSSTLTVRPGHRMSGSLSSVVSMTIPTTTDHDVPSLASPPASRANKNESRPSTAGAVLERTPSLHVPNENSPSPRRRNSIPILTSFPQGNFETPADPSPSKTPKRWSFFGLEPFVAAGSPTRARRASSSSSGTQEKKNSESVSPPGESEPEPKLEASVSQSGDVKTSGRKKKQKRVRSWAGSILTRRSKSRSQKSKSMRRRSQTPPLQQVLVAEDTDSNLFEVSEAPITPMVMVTGPNQSPVEPITTEPNGEPDDFPYPMIDLDAALGPFNTPSSRDPQWEEAQRAGSAPKRQLHSAAGLRGFSGPGMHYHRRAESAPEMPPFEAARFGIHRFGSSSTMADVFEEEEEEEDMSSPDGSAEGSISSSSDDDAGSTPTQEHEPSKISVNDAQQTASIKRKGSGSSLEMQRPGSRMRTENSASGLREEVIIEEPSYDRIFLPAASEATDSGMPSPRTFVDSEVDPLDANDAAVPTPAVAPTTPYSMSYSPSFPSPRSPMSYDARRISTTPSSVTDENNFHSLLMGEPGPELVRISVDVPSLTSSNSTMTRESSFIPGVRPRNMPFHDQRPASFTSTAFGRRRSSLVSLSRLISTAHGGERSKLSEEVPCETEPERKSKMSKSKRLSRIMQFWKPKGSTES